MQDSNFIKSQYLQESLSIHELAQQAAALPKKDLEVLIQSIKQIRQENPRPIVEEVQGEFTNYDPSIIDIEMGENESNAQNIEVGLQIVPNLVELSEYEISEVVGNLAIENESQAQIEKEVFERERIELVKKLETILNTRKEVVKVRSTILDSIEISRSSDRDFAVAQKTEEQIISCRKEIYKIDLESIKLITRIEFLSLSFGQIRNKDNEPRFDLYYAIKKTSNPAYLYSIIDILKEDAFRDNNIKFFGSTKSSNNNEIKPIFDKYTITDNLISSTKVFNAISLNKQTSTEVLLSLLGSQDSLDNEYYATGKKIEIIQVILDRYHLFDELVGEEASIYWNRIRPIITDLISTIDEKGIKRLYRSVNEEVKPPHLKRRGI